MVLLGCFNAVAQQSDYPPLTYRAVKGEISCVEAVAKVTSIEHEFISTKK